MSVGKKHTLSDGDRESEPVTKKAKVDSAADESEEPLKEKKKDKKDKEARKAKKEKKEKKRKEKEAKAQSEEEAAEPEPESTTTTEVPSTTETPQPEEETASKPKKEKKEKKDKKDKKEKKEKKEKKSKDADESTQTDTPQENGASDSKYKQVDALSALPESEFKDWMTEQQVVISEPNSLTTHRPILKFTQLPSSPLLAKKPFAGFTAPTPIQSASWPYSLDGRDVVGIAETGSGKTLAFSVPCINALQALPEGSKPNKKYGATHALAVIVSPTRELAMQTHAAISKLAELVGMSAVCLFGGAPKDEQRTLLRKGKGADIIVATPGRLKDFLSDDTVSLSAARFVVLDEADRMLDKGFEDDVKLILGLCPDRGQRQTLMFTATWPASVRGLAESFMVNPVKVTIGGRTRAVDGDDDGNGVVELQANSRISQRVEVVNPWEKETRLVQLLKEAQAGKNKNDRVLVFCLYKKEAVRVENNLQRKGIRVASIHGDLKQEQRTASLEAFKSGKTTVLVATDVAARGLDIPEVKLVINVTFPLTIEDYVHRIGRTGRAGKQGQAITLFTEHDKAHSGSLVNVLKGANQPVPDDLLKFGTTVKKKAHDTYGAFFKDVDMSKKGTKITFD
ncbi:RNA-dependent ATPase [Pyricularia oryzae]